VSGEQNPTGLAKIWRYWQTVRHLRLVQIYGRLWFQFIQPKPDLSQPPSVRPRIEGWVPPARRKVSIIESRRFCFLNFIESLDQIGWDGDYPDKLWRYNQHYFDDLCAENARSRNKWHQELLNEWITHNPPASGTGWEPYPLSLRLINWIKWILAKGAPVPKMLESMATQARWLNKRMEWHLQGNHLLINAKALLFAGIFFSGDEADNWRAKGTAILSDQLPQQILKDGAQFELSPMYHLLACEDVLDIINLLRSQQDVKKSSEQYLLEICEGVIPAMLGWATAMSHPDGKPAQFNDTAFDVGPSLGEVADYAARLGYSTRSPADNLLVLQDSGYVRVRTGDLIGILDCAKVGPDYLPGHSHADSLSFETSLGSQRVFVNGGTSVYGTGKERKRQRGTAAHNTVVVNNLNSSDVWSGFRVGQRARPCLVKFGRTGDIIQVQASHDGYCRIRKSVMHNRRWEFGPGWMQIDDHVSGPIESAVAHFHLHPDIYVAQIDDRSGTMQLPDGRKCRWTSNVDGIVTSSSWHPEFGQSIDAQQIVLRLVEGQSTFHCEW